MRKRTVHHAALLLAVLGVACVGDVPSAGASRLTDGPLPLLFHDPGSGVKTEVSSRKVDEALHPNGGREDSTARSTRGLVADNYAIIEEHLEDAGFTTRDSKPVAFASGWMRFFGNRARETVSMSLRRKGITIPTFPAISEVSYVFPGRYEIWASATTDLFEDCGHDVAGYVEHRAWNQNQLPVGSNADWLVATLSRGTPTKQQKACPAETKPDTMKVPVSGGGKGDGHLTDEWVFCMYEVWYNSSGQEIYRRLLYCEPL